VPFGRMLRQPLEDGKLKISRASPGTGPALALRSRPALTYPARCTLVAVHRPLLLL